MNPRQDQYVNIHAHRLAGYEEEWVLTSVFAQDYQPEEKGTGIFSVGLHPWHLAETDVEAALQKVRLATEDPDVLAVGEAGLDRSRDIPQDYQLRVFTKQVEIAGFANLPVIIHNVRANQELIRFMKEQRPLVPMIIHGFRGGPQLAEQMLHAGFYLSFGVHFLEDKKTAEALKEIPPERLFLETDEAESDIRILYKKASVIMGLAPEHLQNMIRENVRILFRKLSPKD